jgi:hypothetical protein
MSAGGLEPGKVWVFLATSVFPAAPAPPPDGQVSGRTANLFGAFSPPKILK